jgi:transposase InsO family protein
MNIINTPASPDNNDGNNNINNHNEGAQATPPPPQEQLAEGFAKDLKLDGPRREKQWVKLGFKRSMVEEMYRRKLSPEEFVAELIIEGRKAVGATTLRTWARDYDLDKLDGGERLLDKPRSGRPRKVCDQVLLATFPKVLKGKTRSVKSIYREIEAYAIANKFAMPKYATFNRYVKEMKKAVAERHLKKFKQWYEDNEISISQDDGFSNEIWVTDASQLKVLVIDGTELFKPWVVIFMDKSSRMIMGWMITKDAVRTEDVVVCLKQGIMPKGIHAVEWFGKPKCIHSDNGTPFVSAVFRANLARLEISYTNSPVASPENNGRMERFFRTVGEEWLSGYEDKICSRFVKGEGRAKARWNALADDMNEYVMEYCFARPHSALGGMTPYKAWEARLKDLSTVDIDCKKIDETIYIEKEFKVSKLGVEITPGEFWFCAGFAGLRRHTVIVRMRPEGPSKGMQAYIGDRHLGELVMQGDGAAVAKALKDAQADHQNDVQGLMRTVAKGFVRHKKVLGTIKGEKKAQTKSKAKGKAKAATKSKGKAKKATTNVFKATPVKKGNS